jgi:MFS family permease
MPFTTWPAPNRASLLRNRDFTVSATAQAVSFFGDQVAVIVLVLRLHDHGAGAWGVAGVLAAGALPVVLVSPVAGVLADRWDSRRLLLASTALQVLVCTLLAFSNPVAIVLSLAGVLGAVEAVTSATWQALLPRIVGQERITAAVGLGRTATTAASMLAPAAGGLLAAAFGTTVPLLLDAGSYLAVLTAAIVVRTHRQAVAGDGRPRVRMWDGFAFICSDRVIRPLLTGLLVFVLLGGVVNVVDVFLVRNTFGASDAWYGTVVALWMAGMVIGSLLGGRLRGESGSARAALGGTAIIAGALAAIAAVPTVGWLVPLELAGGFGNGMLNVAAGALLLTRAPEAIRGRVSAAVTGAANAAALGALALGGTLAALLTPRTIFVIAAAGGALCVAVTAIPLTRAVGHRTPQCDPAGPGRPKPSDHVPQKDGIHHVHVQ